VRRMAALRKLFRRQSSDAPLREDLRIPAAPFCETGKRMFPEQWEPFAILVNETQLLNFACPGKGGVFVPE